MIKFNICFIKQGNNMLLLNRDFPSWMGCWNGVGGKIEMHESPRQSMLREINEETYLSESEYHLSYKGLVTWTVDHEHFGGMYLYVAHISEDYVYSTPRKTVEGILDWKSIEWIMNPENQGLAANIPLIMNYMIEESPYHHHCTYLEGKLTTISSEAIEETTEDNERMKSYVELFYGKLFS
ncbi:8-oxo-dGTP diphosphatase [compost metagenome]